MGFNDKSVQHKISIMTLIVIALPLMLFYITITLLYNRAFEERSNQQIRENLGVMSDRVERVFADGVLCSNYLTLNFNSINQEEIIHQVDLDNRIRSVMNQSMLIFGGIDSIVYFDCDGNMYSTAYKLYSKRNEIESSSYFRSVQEILDGSTTLFDKDSLCMQVSESNPVVTMGKRVIKVSTGESLGFLFINLEVKNLENSMVNQISNYYLYDSSGNAIAANNLGSSAYDFVPDFLSDADERKMKKVKWDGRSYTLGMKKISSDWWLVGVTDLRAYNITAVQLFRTFFFASVLTTVLLIWLGIAISKMITKPISKLTEGAEEIANGNLDVQFDFKSRDEIGRMGNIFNHMTCEIKKLLNMVEEEAKEKRKYELALIQQQVKPHFLYNTLDIIIILIEMGKSREASRVTKKLADYYKNSLSSSAEIITLDKEIRIIEDYLDLQLMRYQDKFTYEIDVEAGLSKISVPKLTLQPLIENAIYHGLKYKEDWGNIYVGAKAEGDRVVITVKDNGVGMDAETLAGLKEMSKKCGEHFGVYSVNHRLQLYYGELFEMKIESEQGEGTCFTIIIPKEWKEKAC